MELAESQDEDKSLPLILHPTQDLLDEDIWTRAPPHTLHPTVPGLRCPPCNPATSAWSWPIPQPRPSAKASHPFRAACNFPLWVPQEGIKSNLTLKKLSGQ